MQLYNHQEKWDMEFARRAIEGVAHKEKLTVEEVRSSMMEAIEAAFNTSNLVAQAQWAQIPCEGEIPTPEEVIIWVSKQL